MKKVTTAFAVFVLVVGVAAAQISVGSVAPEVNAREWLNSNGTVRLSELRGSWVVVEFWATWCGPCRTSIPHLIELNDQYENQGVTLMSLTNEDRRGAGVDAFMRDMEMDYIVGTGSTSGSDYGVSGIPHAFLIDPSGIVAWSGHPMGGLDAALADAVAGELRVVAPQDIPATRLNVGATRRGSLDADDERLGDRHVDVYEVSLRPGQDIDIVVTSPSFDTLLRVEGPGGSSIENDDARGPYEVNSSTDSALTVSYPQGGTVRIYVTSYYGGETGDYELVVAASSQSPEPAGIAIAVGEEVSGRLEDGDWRGPGGISDVYVVQGARGAAVRIAVSSGAFDTVLRIAGDGFEDVNDDHSDAGLPSFTDSALDYRFDRAGTLRVYVESYGGAETGGYTLSVRSGPGGGKR